LRNTWSLASPAVLVPTISMLVGLNRLMLVALMFDLFYNWEWFDPRLFRDCLVQIYLWIS
jgi:hypothetical protein